MARTAWLGPSCPQDPEHGVLLGWPGATTAFFCPHRRHVGRQFYDTDLRVAARPDQPISPLRSPRSGARVEGSPSGPSSLLDESGATSGPAERPTLGL